MCHIVSIGGGTGMPPVIKALLGHQSAEGDDVEIMAGCGLSDNGGDQLHFMLNDNCPPLADAMRNIAALSMDGSVASGLEQLVPCPDGMSHKRRNALASEVYLYCDRDIERTMTELHRMLQTSGGEIFPTSLQRAQLCAELDNREVIRGETLIDIPKHDGTVPIVNLWLEPSVEAHPRFIAAIEQAELIIFPCGDLYSSVIAAMLPEGIFAAIRRSKAKKVLVLNLMTKYGETYGYTHVDFIRELHRYIGENVLTDVLVNSTIPTAYTQGRYRDERSQWIWVDPADESVPYRELLRFHPLLALGEPARHDPKLLGKAFRSLYPEIFHHNKKPMLMRA